MPLITKSPITRRETSLQSAPPSRNLLPGTTDFNSTRFGSYHYSTSPLQFASTPNAPRKTTNYGSATPQIQSRLGFESLSGKQEQQPQEHITPTLQMKDGVAFNHDKRLEHEADVMGMKVAQSRQPKDNACKANTDFPQIKNTYPMVIQGMFYEDTEDSNEYIWHWGPVIESIWQKKRGKKGEEITHNGYGVWERKHNLMTGDSLSFYSLIKSASASILKAAPTMAVGYFLIEFLSSLPQAAAQQLMLPSHNTTHSNALVTRNDTGLANDGALIISMLINNTVLIGGLLQQYYAMQRQQQPQFSLQIYQPLEEMFENKIILNKPKNIITTEPGLNIQDSDFKSQKELVDHIAKETGLIEDQVEAVIEHFYLKGEKIGYHSGSLYELSNYVRKVYGKEYTGNAKMPEVKKGQTKNIKQTIKTRLNSQVWEKTDTSELLQQYEGEEAELLKAITQIEIHLKRVGYLTDPYVIEQPNTWIGQYLSGAPFESTPTVNGKGEILWDKNQKKMPKELSLPPHSKTVSELEIPQIFQMLKSQIPGKDPNDGCFARADFSAYYMQVLRGFKNVGKVRVDVKSGHSDLKPTSEHYLEGVEGTVWKMHTASTLTTQEGQTYVMDISLKKPLTVSEWIKALTSLTEDKLIISNTTKWNYHLGDQKENGVSLIDVLSQLRGLHISEMFGHKNSKGLLPWGTWENQKNFAPINPKIDPKVYVLKAKDKSDEKRGIFKGEEISDISTLKDRSSYCEIEFHDENITLFIPKGVTKIRTTGIIAVNRISEKDIKEKCKNVNNPDI